VPLPQVRLGQPEIKENYNYYEQNGIKVYILKSLEAKGDSISIRLTGFLWLKGFEVTGFKVL